MRRCFSWAICGAIFVHSTIDAQQLTPITPNFGRTVKRVAASSLPSPKETIAIGSGVKESVIPQQGAVDLGSSSVIGTPTPSLPSYSYSASQVSPTHLGSSLAAPPSIGGASVSSCMSGNCQGGNVGFEVGSACSSCGSSSCSGGCGIGKLKRLLGKRHHSGQSGGWFGGLYYMRLWRADDNFGYPLAYNSAVPTNTVLASGFARMESANAMGIRLGKMINACSAIEFIYWQAFPEDKTAVADAAFIGSPVTSSINFGSLVYDNQSGAGPVPVNDFFTDSEYISVTRSFDYNNFELNFLKLPFVYGGNSCARARVALLAGVRYFRAAEDLEFFSDDLNNIQGDDPANELMIHNELDNNLVGFQLGCLFDWQFSNRFSGQIGSKVGIYNNHMRHVQSVTGGAGGAIIDSGPYAGQVFGLDTKKDDVAFLGEIDAGVSYCVNSNWRLTGGYKVIGISGYATAMNQIPRSYDDLAAAGLIQNDDSLILHGAYIGAEFCW